MSQLYFGLTAHVWGIIAAWVAPFVWWWGWKWKGRKWFTKLWFRLFENSEDHEEILDLQAKYFGRLFNYIIWISVILIDMNMLGVLTASTTTSRNIWITGGTLTAGVIIGGGTYISFLLAGVRILLEKGFGTGNYVQMISHPYHKIISGWVEKIDLFKTTFRSDIFTRYNVRNSLLLEYIVNNYDSGPFFHEVFKIPVTSENKAAIIGRPPKVDPTTKNEIEAGAESVIIHRLKNEMGGFLMTTDKGDRDSLEVIFKNMDDSTWAWLSQPSILLENDHAVLRVPVRSYRHGLVLKHEISKNGILEV